jgi:hypothetical protein
MKKITLFTCLLCITSFMSYAQLTPSCPCAINAAVFNLITPATSTNPAYYMAQPGPKFHLGRQLDTSDGQNKWSIVYESPGGFVAQYYKTSSNNSLQPPCNEMWEVVGSNPKTYISINFTGNTCTSLPLFYNTNLNPSFTQLPNLTSNMIAAIPNPQAGMMVWDISLNCLKVYTGTSWSCTP